MHFHFVSLYAMCVHRREHGWRTLYSLEIGSLICFNNSVSPQNWKYRGNAHTHLRFIYIYINIHMCSWCDLLYVHTFVIAAYNRKTLYNRESHNVCVYVCVMCAYSAARRIIATRRTTVVARTGTFFRLHRHNHFDVRNSRVCRRVYNIHTFDLARAFSINCKVLRD